MEPSVANPHMQFYRVGGCVRDTLLGKTPKDIDYVVVGATPEYMISHGFKQVGADFPVFLDNNGYEFALARTERKTGSGYHGFETDFNPDITIEQDLQRRDLTINAMAQRVNNIVYHVENSVQYDEEIIDPFNGKQDLKDGILRHVSDAFAEDPVRMLRIARFAARYHFDIADETLQFLKLMKERGEFDSLVAERVWSEVERAMKEPHPWLFFKIIMNCGAFVKLFPTSIIIRFEKLVTSVGLGHCLAVRLIAAGITTNDVKYLKAPKDIIQILNTFDELVNEQVTPKNIITNLRFCSYVSRSKLFEIIMSACKRFDIIRRASNRKVVYEILQLLSIYSNQPLLMRITPYILERMAKVKYSDFSDDIVKDIEKTRINEFLWNIRQDMLIRSLKQL